MAAAQAVCVKKALTQPLPQGEESASPFMSADFSAAPQVRERCPCVFAGRLPRKHTQLKRRVAAGDELFDGGTDLLQAAT